MVCVINNIWKTWFFYSGPAAWNTLPSDLHDITVTPVLSENDSIVYFLIVLTIVGAPGRVV